MRAEFFSPCGLLLFHFSLLVIVFLLKKEKNRSEHSSSLDLCQLLKPLAVDSDTLPDLRKSIMCFHILSCFSLPLFIFLLAFTIYLPLLLFPHISTSFLSSFLSPSSSSPSCFDILSFFPNSFPFTFP